MFFEDKQLQSQKRMDKQGQKKSSRILFWIVLVVLSGVLLYSGYRIYGILSVYHQNAKIQSEIQDIFYEQNPHLIQSNPAQSDDVSDPVISNPLEPLQKINKDVVAWIQIPDTVIDYPVLQGPDNEYYLNYNMYKQYTVCGSIFMDFRNQLDSNQQNLILYGHRMNDESMFGELIRFTDEEFYKEHSSFTLITQSQTYRCDIFSVYMTTIDFEYYRPFFDSEAAFYEYIDTCRQKSMYTSDVEITAKDTVITLSTCDSTLDSTDGRLVVQAKLVPIQ